MGGTQKYLFIKIKKGTHMSSFICSPRVLDCYRLCAPPTFSYLEIEHSVVDCLRYEWNLPLPRPTSGTPRKTRTSVAGLEDPCPSTER